MFTTALYYPHILIPDDLWLTRAILYWDKICPIVPHAVEIPAGHVSWRLRDHGMLDFVRPEEYLGRDDGIELAPHFLKLVTSREYLSAIGPPESRDFGYRVHVNKFETGLLRELEHLGLFRYEGPWCLFEKQTGIIYMGMLAGALAHRLRMEPITDENVYIQGFLTSQVSRTEPYETSVISITFDDLLPVPSRAVSIEEIIRFKERRERELLAFRREMEGILNSIASAQSRTDVERALHSARDQIREQVLALQTLLRENRISTGFAALKSIFSLSMPQIAVILGSAFVSVPLAAAIFGANAAIHVGSEIWTGIVRERSILRENPYAYVFHVKRL